MSKSVGKYDQIVADNIDINELPYTGGLEGVVPYYVKLFSEANLLAV